MLKSSITEYGYVQRAKIILCCAAGKQNKQVAQEIQIAQATVAKQFILLWTITAINNFIKQYNQNLRPFRWQKREVRGNQIADKIINLCN